MKHLLTALSLIALLLSACNDRMDKGANSPSLDGKSKFAIIQATILQPKCMSCHAGAPGHTNLSSYQSIFQGNLVVPKSPQTSRLFIAVNNASMPKGAAPLSKEETQLIADWIIEGAGELDPQAGKPLPINPNAPQATFKWISKNVFEMKCMICHNLQKPRGGVDLSSYQGLMASPGKDGKKPIVLANPLKSTIIIELDEKKMPPETKKLNNGELTALHDWIQAGAPNSPPAPSPSPGPSPTPEPPTPTYAWLSKNLFSRRCGSCHGIPFTVANVDFTSYATLMNSEGKMMKPVVPGDADHSAIYFVTSAGGQMPPPRKIVTQEERDVILQWIQAGAPNNE